MFGYLPNISACEPYIYKFSVLFCKYALISRNVMNGNACGTHTTEYSQFSLTVSEEIGNGDASI